MNTSTTPGASDLRIAGAAVSLVGISKRYSADSAPAVDDVTLDVGAGEFVTLLGPSGSGKTTTLNMIAGFVPLSAGRILIDGQDVAQLPPHRRDLGFVFQSYALFPHMTVADNIAYPLRRRGVPRAEVQRRVEEMTALVELGGLARRKPSELSGGQQQRVALARALAFRPRALLLDEPLAALDRQLRESLQDELRRLHRELGVTVILVTHDQQEALHLSDRVAVFRAGRLEQVATPEELYRRPSTMFVARFFGESRTIAGEVDDAGTLRAGARSIPLPAAHGFAAGSRVTLVVRPEAVRILPGAGRAADDEYVAGAARVADIVYRGATRRVTLRLDDGAELLAAVPVAGGELPGIGDEVAVAWRPAECAVVADSGVRPTDAPTDLTKGGAE